MSSFRPSWGEPTRFAALSPKRTRVILLALLALVAGGIIGAPSVLPSGQPGEGDAALYRAVAQRVAVGQSYYQAAATEQRLRDFPLRPFTTMRPPLLAEIGASLGPSRTDQLLRFLAIVTAIAVGIRLFGSLASPAREAAILLATLSIAGLAAPDMWVWHEIWAGLLVALALACRSDRRWGLAVALGLTAALIRELTMPFLVVMAIAACGAGKRREAAAWASAMLIAIAALALHHFLNAAVVLPGDAASPGWLAFGGWGFAMMLARHCGLLLFSPAWVTAVTLPMALLGWCGLRGAFGARVTATLVIWIAAFLVIGRPDNDFWGFLLVPLLLAGLPLAPAALRDLIARAAWPSLRVMTPALR